MNPELTEDLLAAAPVGSLILVSDTLGINPPAVWATKADADAEPWRTFADGGWGDDAGIADLAPSGAWLYVPPVLRGVPEQDPAAHRMAAQLREVMRERDELRDAVTNPAPEDERVEAWHRVVNHPALQPAFDRPSESGKLIDSVIARLGQLGHLEATVQGVRDGDGHTVELGGVKVMRCDDRGRTEPSTLTARPEGITVGEWAVMGDAARAERIDALSVAEVRELGRAVAREAAEYRAAFDARLQLRAILSDALHGAADAFDEDRPPQVVVSEDGARWAT